MKTNWFRQNVLPVLAALIWGVAIVFQGVGADYLEPFAFNAARSSVAFLFLLLLCAILRLLRRHGGGEAQAAAPRPAYCRDLLAGGICCGAALTAASYLQQKGLETTTPGKTGFITALYIVLVPIIGDVVQKKLTPSTHRNGVQ